MKRTKQTRLNRLQNMVIRFIFSLKKIEHITEHRIQLKWFTIRPRRNLNTLSLIYTVLSHHCTSEYLNTRFSFLGSNHSLCLRSLSDNRLELPMSRTQAYGYSFTVNSAVLWNALSPEIRAAKSVYIFKRRVKNYFLSL